MPLMMVVTSEPRKALKNQGCARVNPILPNAADPDGQGKEQGVDDQGEQAQRQDDQQAGQCLERRAQDGIHQAEDQSQPDDVNPAALQDNVIEVKG